MARRDKALSTGRIGPEPREAGGLVGAVPVRLRQA